MEKKVIKRWSDLFQTEFTLTVDERLNKIDIKKQCSESTAKANKELEKIKHLLHLIK